MRMRCARPAAAIVAAGALLVGISVPASATDSSHGRREDGRSFLKHDRDRWNRDDHHHDWKPRDPGPTVIARGLNNPRQLSLPLDAALLIAEAGRGGPTCEGEGEEAGCIGDTGSVSVRFLPQRWGLFHTPRIVTGLFSFAGPDGSFAVGSDGVAYRDGRVLVQETFAPPDLLPVPLNEQSGKLLAARPWGEARPVADISAYELANDPDGMGPDSNPYAVLSTRDRVLVADAAANTVFSVDRHGEVSVFHVFPNIVNDVTTTPNDQGFPGYDPTPEFPGAHFVPTSLAEGPHGEIYVGGLASELSGQAQVVQLDKHSGDVVRTWSGFTTITGVAVGRDGALYVSQLFAPQVAPIHPEIGGVLTKVSRNGTRTDKDVPFPAGVAVDSWDNVYVAAFSVAPEQGFADSPEGVDTSGQVWRLRF